MKIAVIQLAYGDAEPVAERVDRVVDLIAAQRGHDLVVLPELWPNTGFGYRRWEDSAEPLDGPIARAMAGAARSAGLMLHAGSLVERLAHPGLQGRTLANTSLVFDTEGRQLAVYRKIHRFGFGSGEPDLLEAGADDAFVALGSRHTAALSTCYDLRFPELYRRQLDGGAHVFLVPAAWPMARVEHWRLLGRARAIENQCLLVAVNTAGTHAGHEMGGASQVVSPRGEVLAEAASGEQVLSVEVDLETVQQARADFPVLRDRRLWVGRKPPFVAAPG